jgi:hypothetical protein
VCVCVRACVRIEVWMRGRNRSRPHRTVHHTHTHKHTNTHTQVDFDGVYIYYVDASVDASSTAIRFHSKVSHHRSKSWSDEFNFGWGRWGGWGGGGEDTRQIYRAVYMDSSLITVSDRELQIHKLGKEQGVSKEEGTMELLAQLNSTLPQCLDSNFNRPVPWYRGYPPR